MPGFEKLRPERQLEIVNDVRNLRAVDVAAKHLARRPVLVRLGPGSNPLRRDRDLPDARALVLTGSHATAWWPLAEVLHIDVDTTG